MAEKKSGARTSNSVNVSLRLDPKTKYLIDLLARDQKRTITGVIEWALERAADQERFDVSSGYDGPSFRDMLDVLWSTDEAMRLVALAFNKPSLLDYDEMRIWETIKASPDLWRIPNPTVMNRLELIHLNVEMVQAYWEPIIDHVARHKHASAIRPFKLTEHGVSEGDVKKMKTTPPSLEEFDDEIPF
ncbi:hypothetical protein FIU88_08325 [Halomonas sp. THAF12]|uniref:hypothetical protein n=1 Tax=Halomonas sp. THAF12 TaxID=2587849 RepID=UPI001268D8B3|nr:hypothetical protein [Halomonas sp. THAF12]QFT84980.1 hypothetical protein FIU88_08325 [Halomonas sp. THAF12]